MSKIFTAVIEKDPVTQLYIGYVPGITGAHSQGKTIDELREHLKEVLELLYEENELEETSIFIGTQQIDLAA